MDIKEMIDQIANGNPTPEELLEVSCHSKRMKYRGPESHRKYGELDKGL